jgi:hypothetical protein
MIASDGVSGGCMSKVGHVCLSQPLPHVGLVDCGVTGLLGLTSCQSSRAKIHLDHASGDWLLNRRVLRRMAPRRLPAGSWSVAAVRNKPRARHRCGDRFMASMTLT